MILELVDKKVWRGKQPNTKEDLQVLWDCGVRTIICLQEGWKMWKDERHYWQELGGVYAHFGFSNFFAPTQDEIKAVFQTIKDFESDGKVFIHCLAGVDRTGYVSGAWLVHEGVMPPESAWQYVKENGMHFWYYPWKKNFMALVNPFYKEMKRLVK